VPLSLLEQVRAAQRALRFAEFSHRGWRVGVPSRRQHGERDGHTRNDGRHPCKLATLSLSIGTPPSSVKRKIVVSVLVVQDLFQHLLSARDALAADEIARDRQKARKPPCREQRVGSSSNPG